MTNPLWVGLHSPSTDCLNFLTARAFYDLYPLLIDQAVTISQPILLSQIPTFLFSFGLRTYRTDSSFYRNCPYVCPLTRRETTATRSIRIFAWQPEKQEEVLVTGRILEWRLGKRCTNHACPNNEIIWPRRQQSWTVRRAS